MDARKTLEKYTEGFKTSEPIFTVRLSHNEDEVRLELLNKYRPEPIPNNVLSELVCENFEESFHVRSAEDGFTFSRGNIVSKSITSVRSRIITFIEKNLPMRNPRQSKLYRWAYRNMPQTNSINDGLVLIYQYVRPFCDSDMRITEVENKPHLDNTIALLDALREKHGEE